MALLNLTKFEALIASYIPYVGEIVDYKRENATDKALSQLYDSTDALTMVVVRLTVALLWWASHIASATSDSLGYAAQIEAALAKADDDILSAWQEWLNIKYPADLRKLYDDLSKSTQAVKKSIPKQQKVNLKPIEAEIAALEKWKKVTVTPDLKSWISFYTTWKTTYVKPVTTLISWLKTPKLFAQWATPPILSYLPSIVQAKPYQPSLTTIEAALVSTWTNDPSNIFTGILNWLVST